MKLAVSVEVMGCVSILRWESWASMCPCYQPVLDAIKGFDLAFRSGPSLNLREIHNIVFGYQ